MEVEKTSQVFRKILWIAIVSLVLIASGAVIRAALLDVAGAPIYIVLSNVMVNFTISIVLAVAMIVIAAIGRANGKKIPLLAFVFAIIIIGLSAGLIAENGWQIRYNIEDIYLDVTLASGGLVVLFTILDLVQLALVIVIVILSILNILRGVSVLRLSQGSTKSQGGAIPAGTLEPRAGAGQTSLEIPETVAENAAGEDRFCAECGAPLANGAKFCRRCGTAV